MIKSSNRLNATKIAAATVAVLFLLCLLLASLYIYIHGHDCGEHTDQSETAVCVHVTAFKNLLSGGLAASSTDTAGGLLFVLLSVIIVFLFLAAAAPLAKIRMNN